MATKISVKPWARGPLELLQHAEEHRLGKRDFDRRVALIGFDNAIESSVITFLSLNPAQRNGRCFAKADVEKWLANFNSKVAFLEHFTGLLQQTMLVDPAEFIYYHQLRNELYHNGNGMVPAEEHIQGARNAAIWTFSVLFGYDAEALLADIPACSESPGVASAVSASTAFLESFIEAKKELDELVSLLSNAVKGHVRIDQLVQALQQKSPIPQEIVSATLEAEKAKDQVVRGDDAEVSEARLKELTTGLESASNYFKQQLRLYQHEIVESALSSTVEAVAGGYRAGVVWQPTGTGLSMTLLAYIARCKSTPGLREIPLVVVVDRTIVAQQLQDRVRHHQDGITGVSALRPGDELVSTLAKLEQHQFVITTWQRLRRLDRTTLVNPCLVVCFNLHSASIPDFDPRDLFPRGTCIYFGSSPVAVTQKIAAIFGNVIGAYDFPTAVADGYLLPVKVEHRSMPSGEAPVGMVGSLASDWRDLEMAQVRSVAHDLVDELSTMRSSAFWRFVLIVKSRTSGAALMDCLNEIAHKNFDAGELKRTTIAHFHAGARPLDFSGIASSHQVLICTPEWLSSAGLDLPGSYYVTCKLSADQQYRIAAMASRPNGISKVSRIVDYAHNSWESIETCIGP